MFYFGMHGILLQNEIWITTKMGFMPQKNNCYKMKIGYFMMDFGYEKNATKCSLQNLDVCPSLISSFATKWLLVSFWGQYFLLQNEDWFRFGVKIFCYKMKIGFYHPKIIEKKLATKWQSGCLLQNGFPESFFAFCRMSEWLFRSVHKFSHSVVEILLWGVLTWAPWFFSKKCFLR